MEWIHCNACYEYGKSLQHYVLTQCGHLLCKLCKKTVCPVCNKRTVCSSILDNKGSVYPEFQHLFTPLEQLIKNIGH